MFYDLSPEQVLRFEQLRLMSPAEYEKICKGCGLCCLYKLGTENTTFYTNMCCQYLDVKTKRCSVYCDRLKIQSAECEKVTPDSVLRGMLPRTCGYVEYVFGPAKKQIKVNWGKVRPGCGVNDLFTLMKTVIFRSGSWNER